MKTAREKLLIAQEYAMTNRPKVGGFPFLAECLRQAGVEKNVWHLPSVHCFYFMEEGLMTYQGTPLLNGISDIPSFDQDVLISALRTDQAGHSTFPEFLMAAWKAGVVRYDVDFLERAVTYYGARGETYQESYPAVEVFGMSFE